MKTQDMMRILILAAILVAPLAAAQQSAPSGAVAGKGSEMPAVPVPGNAGLSDTSGARNPFPNEGQLFDTFRDVANELRCPTCTGLSVLDSDAAFSTQIRDIVKEQVAAGKSKPEILKYFTERYGPWILRMPPTAGFNALAWALPLGLLLLGPPLVWFFVWRKRKVVSTMGVRGAEDIVAEMNTQLMALRAKLGDGGVKA